MSTTEKTSRCPVCRAQFRNQPVCSRCGADLAPLMTLALKAYLLRQSGRNALLQGDFSASQKRARQAQKLCATPTGRQLSILTSWLLSCARHPVPAPHQPALKWRISEPESEFESKQELKPPSVEAPSWASTTEEKIRKSLPVAEKQNLITKSLRFIKKFVNR